jgi:hypothetical protein
VVSWEAPAGRSCTASAIPCLQSDAGAIGDAVSPERDRPIQICRAPVLCQQWVAESTADAKTTMVRVATGAQEVVVVASEPGPRPSATIVELLLCLAHRQDEPGHRT